METLKAGGGVLEDPSSFRGLLRPQVKNSGVDIETRSPVVEVAGEQVPILVVPIISKDYIIFGSILGPPIYGSPQSPLLALLLDP